ncbi:MAG: site-specific integrase [Deltaproteobacteria bacterium]|nr:site-specific integrase [Deltaproteobacteria bacterium]
MNYSDTIAKTPKTLTELEQRLLLKTSGEHRAGFRDHVIFSVALGTGLREHEILALNIGDVYDASGKVRRRVQLRVFKQSSKDADCQEVLFPDTLRNKLDKYFGWKKRKGEDTSEMAPLFVSRNNKRLSARQLRHAFGVWQKRAGFERRFSFHAIRHSSCSNLYRATRDIRITQRFARHKSIVTTTIYTHPSDEDLLRSVRDLPC